MSTSRGVSSASCARTFCAVRMLIDCSAMPTNDDSCSRVISGVPMLTAITTSAPIAFTMSTGRFLTSPPSPRTLPSNSMGAKTPGTDMLPRIATYSGPRSKTTSRPSTMSVATARNGIGRRSKQPASSWRHREPVQQQLELLAGERAGGQAWREIAESELQRNRVDRFLLLAPNGEVAARRLVREERRPVEAREELLQLRRRHARRVEAADERAHAGRADVVDRHAQFLQHLEHADVGEPACRAAREHEPDLRPRGACRLRRGGGRWRGGARRGRLRRMP